jgi:hypothetical protein
VFAVLFASDRLVEKKYGKEVRKRSRVKRRRKGLGMMVVSF